MQTKKVHCISDKRWYSYNPYETKCTVCGCYWPEDEPAPECRQYKEWEMKTTRAQNRLLDPANPKFMPADRSKWIEWQKSDYEIEKDETNDEYWNRVREDIIRKRFR